MTLLASNLLVYLLTGCAAGYLAGLLGVGGGIVVVPVLTVLFENMHFPSEIRMPLVIGTSMATVALTALWSARTHHRNGNVDWRQVRLLLPMVLLGVLAGSLTGAFLPRQVLAGCVVVFELSVAGVFLYEALLSGKSAEEETVRKPPKTASVLGTASLLAAISSVVGIAGGSLFVPFLHFCGTGMRKAIGTASALGMPIGFGAACVYLLVGLSSAKALPAYSAGYVYLPACAGCVAGSLWTTKHGAALARKMKTRGLKLAFALVLLVAAGKMILSLR
jgi:uncharacterized membrane protein YfcA